MIISRNYLARFASLCNVTTRALRPRFLLHPQRQSLIYYLSVVFHHIQTNGKERFRSHRMSLEDKRGQQAEPYLSREKREETCVQVLHVTPLLLSSSPSGKVMDLGISHTHVYENVIIFRSYARACHSLKSWQSRITFRKLQRRYPTVKFVTRSDLYPKIRKLLRDISFVKSAIFSKNFFEIFQVSNL